MEELYVLLERKYQGQFTEPDYFESAEDSAKVVGVYCPLEVAKNKKERLELLVASDSDKSDIYYEIVPRILNAGEDFFV